MSGTILIRNASHGDASAIASIHIRTWQAAYADIIPADFLDSLSVEKRTTFWESELSGNRSINRVAVENNHIVGWVSGGPGRDTDSQKSSEVYAIYVAPEAWGQGIGRRLMQQIEREILQDQDLTLWVLEQNHPAILFYRHLGYEPDGFTKAFQIGGTDLTEIRLRKKWTPAMISANLGMP